MWGSQIVEMKILFSSCKCYLGGKKKATPDVVSIKQPKTSSWIWFALSFCLFSKEHHSSDPHPVLCCRRFRQNSFIVVFSRSTLPNCVLSNTLHYQHFPVRWFMHFKQVNFLLSKQEQHIFLPFCSKRIKTSCLRTTKIENVKRYEELWVKTNFFNVFVAL